MKMATFLGSSFVLALRDLQPTSEVLRQYLQLEVYPSPPGWSVLGCSAFVIWMGECPDAIPMSQCPDHSFFAYLVVDDVQEVFDRFAGSSGIVERTLTNNYGTKMREFSIVLPEGHRMSIGQRIG